MGLPWEGRLSLPPGVNHSHNPVVVRRRGADGRTREHVATIKAQEQRDWEAGARADLLEQRIPRLDHGIPVAMLFDVVLPDQRKDLDGPLKAAVDMLADPDYGLSRPNAVAPARLVRHKNGTQSLAPVPRWNDRFVYTVLLRKTVRRGARGHIAATVGADQPALFDIVRALLRRPALLEVVRSALRTYGEDV